MYQGESIIAKPRNKNIIMGPSKSPKGMGRRNPHSSFYTRKGVNPNTDIDAEIAAINISNGLDKISLFFTGNLPNRKPVIPKENPFKAMMDSILKFNK